MYVTVGCFFIQYFQVFFMREMSLRCLQALFLLELIACWAERDADASHAPPRFKEWGADDHHLIIYKDNERMHLNRDSGPRTLEVYLKMVEDAKVFELTFPPGYEMTKEDQCGIVKSTAREDPRFGPNVNDLSEVINSCEAKEISTSDDEEGESPDTSSEMPGSSTKDALLGESESAPVPRVRVTIHIKSNKTLFVPQEAPIWWYFAIHIWNPDVDPKENDFWIDQFEDTMARIKDGAWKITGNAILGDWPCKYSDWENVGGCSARCGKGTLRQIRKVLIEPPPDGALAGKSCTEGELTEREVTCNDFDCEMQCELVDKNEAKEPFCSSECGGGLKATRLRWRGENCPGQDDISSAVVSSCNAQPCKVKCVLADTWTVVTECSELCGMGSYRMMRMVLKKDADDQACQPEWKEVPCVRQLCTPLTVLRPDRHIWPLANDWYRVGLAFKLEYNAVKITLMAPDGFSFGTPGSACNLYDHDMMPEFKSCTVGQRNPEGNYHDSHLIELDFQRELLKNRWGRYHFLVSVKNPECPPDKYEKIGGSDQGEKCVIEPSRNMWAITFEEEGKTQRRSLWAAGYDLFKPEDDMTELFTGWENMEQMFLGQGATNAATSISLDHDNLWRQRDEFCSARFDDCPEGQSCREDGTCSETTDKSGLPPLDGPVDHELSYEEEDSSESEDHDGQALDRNTTNRETANPDSTSP